MVSLILEILYVQTCIIQDAKKTEKPYTFDPQNPLHQIARDHPELLTKTMSFTTLHNVALPLKTQRLDDVAEYLMDAAETQANQAPDPNSTKAKLRRLGLPAIFDLSHDQSSNAIDLITQAIAQTTEITKHEADPVVLSERWKIIERYLPHSLQPTITTLKQAAEDQNGLS